MTATLKLDCTVVAERYEMEVNCAQKVNCILTLVCALEVNCTERDITCSALMQHNCQRPGPDTPP